MKFLFPVAAAALLSAVPASAQLVVNANTIGQRVVVQNTGSVVARFEGFGSAVLSSTLFLEGRNGAIFNNFTSTVGSTVDLGTFAAGTELIFRLDVLAGQVNGTNIAAASYFTGPADRNFDNAPHAAVNSTAGGAFVGFEDLPATTPLRDNDYDDLIFSFTNTAAASAVPEPATWGLMLAGFALTGTALRRRRVSVAFA